MRIRRYLFGSVFCVFAVQTQGTDYYVSNSGSDSNTGTSSGSPWATLSKVNGKTFMPGDKIKLERGSVWAEQLILADQHSGEDGNRVIVTDYGNATNPPTILLPSIWYISYTNDNGWTYDSNSNSWWIACNPPDTTAVRAIEKDPTTLYYKPLRNESSLGNLATNGPGGRYFDESIDRIYVRPYGDTNPTSDGKTYYAWRRHFSPSIRVDADYIKIKGIHVAVNYKGIDMANDCIDVMMEGITVSGCVLGVVMGGMNARLTDSEIRWCGDAIGGYPEGATGIEIDYNILSEPVWPFAEWEGIALRRQDDLHIHHNTISGFQEQITIYTDDNEDPSENILIHHNLITGSGKWGISFRQNGTAQFAGVLRTHHNVFEHNNPNSSVAIRPVRPVDGTTPLFADPLEVYHNTINTRSGIQPMWDDATWGADIENMIIKNNLFNCEARNFYVDDVSSMTIDYNLYYASGGGGCETWIIDGETLDWDDWQSLGYDANGILGNANVCATGAYPYRLSLAAPNPGVDDGVWIEGLGTDFYGVIHSNPPSMGAAEEGLCSDP